MKKGRDFSWADSDNSQQFKHETIVAIPPERKGWDPQKYSFVEKDLEKMEHDPHKYAFVENNADAVVDSFKEKVAKTLSDKRAKEK